MGKPFRDFGRRTFLTAIGAAGAAITAKPAAAEPAATAPPAAPATRSAAEARHLAAIDTAQVQLQVTDGWRVTGAGSDFMVDVLRTLGYDYVLACPGSTFRGLQESVINYPTDGRPEWITVVHEDLSAGMAHGYYKAAGKPAAIMVHNTVGLQHAMMSIYNAWADRAPMMIITGNYADAAQRLMGAEWAHSAVDDAQMLQGMIKYNDQPASLQHYAESMYRAHGIMMTPPMGPVFIVADQDLQERGNTSFPKLPPFVAPTYPAADPNAVEEIAKLLVGAEEPVIVVDRVARSQADVARIVALAELLQAPVVEQLGRMNFPTNHHLYAPASVIGRADVILALEPGDLFGTVAGVDDEPVRRMHSKIKPGTKVISIDSEMLVGAGTYQDKQRFYQANLPVTGDAATTLPSLIEAVQRAMPAARKAANADRAEQWQRAFRARREADINAAAVGWDASPISVPRMVMELYNQIKAYDWAMVSETSFQSNWPQRLWDFTQFHQFIGGQGGDGVGYAVGATMGAALAHRSDGVLPVSLQGDGDFLMGPGALWTLAHHKLPLLMVIHNNRAWHNETMKVQIVAGRRDRHPERGTIGTVLTEPNIDYAKIAQGFGVYSEGPISNPNDLGAAFARAVKMVRSGHPALVDVVSQPR